MAFSLGKAVHSSSASAQEAFVFPKALMAIILGHFLVIVMLKLLVMGLKTTLEVSDHDIVV